ncbi:MAG TPA: nitrilase-related carbon-nitrogen hydrolase, partial [Aggregatilineales bacterium]|nr:nitrilase-related carbon-nitrogen hydrolase [Aggregatilineales bacterium]
LICCLTSWEASAIDEFKTYARSRAYENALFVAAANRVGEDVTMTFGGESLIVNPRGKALAALEVEADRRKEMQREADAMQKEIASLKESKAVLEAAMEAKREADKKAKEADEAKKDGVTLKEETSPKAEKDEAKAVEKTDTAAEKASEPAKVLGLDRHSETSEPVRRSTERKALSASEGYCIARIDLDEVRRYREEFQTLQYRQPTAYKAIVKRY